MSHNTTGPRALSILAGVGLLGATAHLTILGLGGYSEPHTYLVIAMAVAVAIGGLTVSRALSDKRYTLALCIAVGLLSGEGYGLISTGERVIVEREAKQAPIIAAQKAHDDAKTALKDARTAKSKLDERVITDAAKKDCVKNCRALLEQQVNAATAAITKAEQQLADAPAPDASATPLADRTGIASWKIDLFTALLAALCGNLLGAAMIAAGAHSSLGAGDTRSARRPPAPEVKERPRIIVSDDPAPRPELTTVRHSEAVNGSDSAKVVNLFEAGSKPFRTVRVAKDAALADLNRRLAAGERFGSQDELKTRYGVAKSTMSNWLGDWEAAGLIPSRQQAGRCKMVAAR